MSHPKDTVFSVDEVLAMACAIDREIGFTSVSKYISADDGSELRWNNKEHLIYQMIPSLANSNYKVLFKVTKADVERTGEIIKFFRRLSFGVLADNINDYKARVFKVTQLGTVTMADFGVLASLPSVYEKENNERIAKQLIAETVKEHIGKVDDTVELEIVYIRCRQVEKLGCFAFEAITSTNHLVSFLNKNLLGTMGTQQKIRAKIKAHGENYGSKTPETKLNYVKVIDKDFVWQ